MKYLGTIVTIANASVNNTNTAGTPFTIPFNVVRLLIVTPVDNAQALGFNLLVGTGSGLAASANDFNVAGSTSTQIECPSPGPNATVIAIFVPTLGLAGNVKVYGLYGSATS